MPAVAPDTSMRRKHKVLGIPAKKLGNCTRSVGNSGGRPTHNIGQCLYPPAACPPPELPACPAPCRPPAVLPSPPTPAAPQTPSTSRDPQPAATRQGKSPQAEALQRLGRAGNDGRCTCTCQGKEERMGCQNEAGIFAGTRDQLPSPSTCTTLAAEGRQSACPCSLHN